MRKPKLHAVSEGTVTLCGLDLAGYADRAAPTAQATCRSCARVGSARSSRAAEMSSLKSELASCDLRLSRMRTKLGRELASMHVGEVRDAEKRISAEIRRVRRVRAKLRVVERNDGRALSRVDVLHAHRVDSSSRAR